MKAIALDKICLEMAKAAKRKNFYTIETSKRYSKEDETNKYEMNKYDHEFWGIWKFVKSFGVPCEIAFFELFDYFPSEIYSELFLIHKIVINGEEFEVETLEEILSAIETHKKFMEYSEK